MLVPCPRIRRPRAIGLRPSCSGWSCWSPTRPAWRRDVRPGRGSSCVRSAARHESLCSCPAAGAPLSLLRDSGWSGGSGSKGRNSSVSVIVSVRGADSGQGLSAAGAEEAGTERGSGRSGSCSQRNSGFRGTANRSACGCVGRRTGPPRVCSGPLAGWREFVDKETWGLAVDVSCETSGGDVHTPVMARAVPRWRKSRSTGGHACRSCCRQAQPRSLPTVCRRGGEVAGWPGGRGGSGSGCRDSTGVGLRRERGLEG